MRKLRSPVLALALLACGIWAAQSARAQSVKAELAAEKPQDLSKYNVLFIISDDLTSTALSCYGNTVSKTPNIDSIAQRGVLFKRAYCQGTYCGPSRASFLTGYYPHALNLMGYGSPRDRVGDLPTWPQHFKNHGYHTTRIGKIYHLGVPGQVEQGVDGADDPLSWTEKFNAHGPEWRSPGEAETLENNPEGKKPAVGGNTFVVVEAEGDDLLQADGKTAAKAVEKLAELKDQRFFLAVGFVRPHIPFVAPKKYFEPYKPYDQHVLPERNPNWDNIPKAGINYRTTTSMEFDERKAKKAIGGYYGAVAFLDAQVGKVLDALKANGLEDNTIVIFTSDHGFHLGEHDFWAKVSLREESASVPLIIAVPGQKPQVTHSLVELLDLYPTITQLAGLPVPEGLQGKDIAPVLADPSAEVRDTVFSTSAQFGGFLLRTDRWAFLQYGEHAGKGVELYDMHSDPKQLNNLAGAPEHQDLVASFKQQLTARLKEVRTNNLPPPPAAE